MLTVDANVVLRYLLQDNEELSREAASIIEENSVFIPFEVIAEIVYVLEKVYEVEKEDICRSLGEFFDMKNVQTNDSGILGKAIEIFKSNKIDFVDTLLCGYALVRGDEVKSFDKKINKILDKHKTKEEKDPDALSSD